MHRFGFSAALRDAALIAPYDAYHAAPWPGVLTGLRRIGLERMQIFRRSTELLMVIDAPETFDAATAFAQLIEDPTCRRWDQTMRELQSAARSGSDQPVWHQMVSIFDFKV